MNVTRQMNLSKKYAGLWKALLPGIGTPEQDQFVLWAGQYTETQVVQGINRAARKVRSLRDTAHPMTKLDAVMYASSVMRNERCGYRDFSGRRNAELAISGAEGEEQTNFTTEDNE